MARIVRSNNTPDFTYHVRLKTVYRMAPHSVLMLDDKGDVVLGEKTTLVNDDEIRTFLRALAISYGS